MQNTIICKHCGKEIEITEALLHQVKADVEKSVLEQHKKDLAEIEERIKKETTAKQGVELEDLKRQITEQKAKNDELREEQLKLRGERRKLEEEKKDFELEMQKQVESKVKESLEKEDERHRLRELENEKKLQDAIKANEELRRKLEQGSQQTQGEVLELDLENMLINKFPTDEIVPIKKGEPGADIRHIIKTARGNKCGVILWETKRAKVFGGDWTEKLKNNLRAEQANIPIIVTTVMPKEIAGGMGLKDGVWICNFLLAPILAELVRRRLYDVAREKFIAQDKEGKSEALYEYVTGHEFIQQVEAIVEIHEEINAQVYKEKAAFEKQWQTRLEYSEKLMKNTARMVGSIQGKLGPSNPLSIKGLDLLELPDGEDENEKEE